jgi:hypothetical protein
MTDYELESRTTACVSSLHTACVLVRVHPLGASFGKTFVVGKNYRLQDIQL